MIPKLLRLKYQITMIFFWGCSANTALYAQSAKNPFELPATIPVPKWVKQVDWENPNLWKIDSIISVYKLSEKSKEKERRRDIDASAKSKEIFDEEELNEEPYETAYKRWRIEMNPYIQSNGDVHFNPNFHKDLLNKAIAEQNIIKKTGGGTFKTTSSANWKALGPIESFSDKGGAKTCWQANVYLIAIAPSNPSTLYCITETGTIFKSLNKGLNWVSVSDALPPLNGKALVVDPSNENVVYCCSNGTILKTTNAGSTWTTLSSYTGGGGEKMIINPITGRVLIAGSKNIYYSDNGGTTWTIAAGSTIAGSYYDIEFNPAKRDTIYAVANDASKNIVMIRSTDGGNNFNTISSGLSGIQNAGARIGVSIANPNIVYCIALGNTVPPKLLKSTDRGTNWTTIATSTGLGGSSTTGLTMPNGQGFYDLDILVSPSNVNHVIVGTMAIYKSTDGGVNFGPLNFALHPDLQCAKAIGSDTYITTDGGVNYSTDFFSNLSNWSVRNHGITGTHFWGFDQGWDEDIVVGGSYHNGDLGVYESYGVGNSLKIGGAEDATGHVFPGNNRTVGFRDIGTIKIPPTLSGAVSTASISNTKWTQDISYGNFSSRLMIDPRYSNVFYLAKDSFLWKSTNSGSSYNALHNFGNGNTVWRYDIARSNCNYIYLCAKDGIYKSTDAGLSWVKLFLPMSTYNYYNTDIVVNPTYEKEAYVCLANNPASEKVFHTTDGGVSWQNVTGTLLNGKNVFCLQYQGGTNGGVYACVRENQTTRVYYRDNSMSNWIDFSYGLPNNFQGAVGELIFYRDSKIRISGMRGIWESPLYSIGSPVAQPMADKKYINCSRDTVNFFDYSMINYAGANWQWSFPGASWVSSTTSRNPKVVYSSPGSYTVSLKVTDATSVSHTQTINDMIIFGADNCQPDTVAGKCINTLNNARKVNIGAANINSNTFSLSCWIKPNGNQGSFSQILGHFSCPGSSVGLSLGFTFSSYKRNLELCYTDDIVNYRNVSGLICDSTKWNFVVLTYAPTGVKIYLNGVGADVNTKAMPVLNLSQDPFYINPDIHGQGGNFNGQIDEIKIYDHTLSQNEVREKMHLIQNNARYESGLVKYIQFNNYDPISETVYDIVQGNNINIPTANITNSTAPIATGTVFRIPMVNAAGLYNFSNADVKLYLPSTGTYPNGEMVTFHLLSSPDQNPDSRSTVPGYFIINNFGTNKTFSDPDSIRFSNLRINSPWYKPENFKLFKRGSLEFGATWGTEIDSAKSIINIKDSTSLLWSGSIMKNLGQIVLINNKIIPLSIANVNSVAQATSSISDLYPNPANDWVKVDVETKMSKRIGIAILDLHGKKLFHTTDELRSGKNTLMINLPQLAEGVYIVQLLPEGEKMVNRKLRIE